MSKIALEEFQQARVDQSTKNDARRIRARIEAAQESPARASVRWPFELMQNAHDAGPRPENDYVEIEFILRENELVVSHTGKPFDARELTALLTGGSSKEFDDEETTGRFGTGFLATHVLSTRVDVDAVLTTDHGHEHFHIQLARDGDENSIIANIEETAQSIQNAEIVPDTFVTDHPTATFIYHDVNSDVASRGLARLLDALPYLYATCERLGQVRIVRPECNATFNRGSTSEKELDGFTIRKTEVAVIASSENRQLVVVHVSKDDQSALLVILDNGADQARFVLSDADFPKFFVRFPIAGTGFLPFNFVVEGRFTPQQERDGILMNQNDKALIRSALSALPSLVRYAVESDWHDAHKLASLSVPEGTFSGEKVSGETEWWRQTVINVAKTTAREPIIETDFGRLPALPGQGNDTVSFLVASIDAEKEILFDYEYIHALAAALNGLHVPVENVAQDWSAIAHEWNETGVEVERLGIEELIASVRIRSNSIYDMPILGDPFCWLAQLLLLIDDLPEEFSVNTLVDGIIPDQHGKLHSSRDLRIDGGISEEIKDIASDVGVDLRSQLVHKRLLQAVDSQGYETAKNFVIKLCGEPYSEIDAIDRILETLATRLPDGTKLADEDVAGLPYLRAAARMVSYLANKEDIQRLRKCPLLTAAHTTVHLTNQQILAPIRHWPDTAQSYAGLYTQNRILSDRYCQDSEFKRALIPLISARLAIPAPLYQAVRAEIDANLLNAMSVEGQDTANVTVRNETFGQIAFLSTDLVQRCGHDPSLARLLLDFVLNVAAKEDQNWRVVKNVSGTKAGESIPLSLKGSTWPFELKVRAWVPVQLSEESNEEGFAPYPANQNYLRELDEDSLRRSNPDARELLHQVFGFERLDLILANLDDQVKSELEELLEDDRLVGSAVRHRNLLKTAEEKPEVAQLISEVGTEEVAEIREELAERQRKSAIRETNRSFGHAAQAALANAIESYGLDLELVDRGYDYEVFAGDLDDAPFSFTVGSYFLEVKATTTGDVRLTPLQAETAAEYPDRFVLCVIDLRHQELKSTWDRTDVEPFAKIVRGIGAKVEDVFEFVGVYTSNDEPVRLRNEEQLRYGLSAGLWENGISIDKWVQSLTPTPQPDTSPSHPS